MNLAELQHLLLDLLSTHRPVSQSSLDALAADDWRRLLDMAREQRLLPMLHWRLAHERADLVVEESLRARLRDAYRHGTLRALKYQRALGNIVQVLSEADIPCLALKGAYLAFAVYRQPAMRPLRDLDVLVHPAQALAADAALRRIGYVTIPGVHGDPEACLATNKHLPALVAPGTGVVVEVHARLTAKGDGSPHGLDSAGLWQRQIQRDVAGQKVAYLSPTDLLLHLIYHAAYDHQLDNGPLTLCDLAELIGTGAIDWSLFWQRTRDSGWERGSLLLLRMTQRYFGDLGIPFDGIAADELDAATRFAAQGATLTLRSHDRLYAEVAASLAGQSLPRKLKLLVSHVFPTPGKLALKDADTRRSVPGLLRAYGRKFRRVLVVRIPRVLGELRHGTKRREIRREGRQAAELGRWLTRT